MRNLVLITCLSLLQSGIGQSQTATRSLDPPEQGNQNTACIESPLDVRCGRSATQEDGVASAPSASELGPNDRLPIDLDQKAASAATSSSYLPDAPSALWKGSNSTNGTHALTRTTMFIPPTLVMEKNTNRSWHTLDREFIRLHTFSTVALIADIVTTSHGLAAHPDATELNPLFGKRPTLARIVGTAVPIHAFAFYLSYRMKKLAPRRDVWKFPPKFSIAIHTAAAFSNFTQAP